MKALVISDIHSNFEALVTVANAHNVDQVWCMGDLVDFGSQPAEVVQWVRHHCKHIVRGNHDQALAYGMDCYSSPQLHALSVATRHMNRELLTESQEEYLRNLPLKHDLDAEGFHCRFGHADPHGDLYRQDLKPDVSDEVLAKAVEGIEADFIFCGHTHFPMIREIGSKTFINPGAVGIQFDGDPRASYAIWRDGKVKLHRCHYDYEAAVQKVAESSLSLTAKEDLIDLIREGRPVKRV